MKEPGIVDDVEAGDGQQVPDTCSKHAAFFGLVFDHDSRLFTWWTCLDVDVFGSAGLLSMMWESCFLAPVA